MEPATPHDYRFGIGVSGLPDARKTVDMRIAYFDCFNGAGGDMIVASLIDAGADADALREGLAGLGVSGYALSLDRVTRQGFAAMRFDVRLDESEKTPHRGLSDIVEILERSPLSAAVKERARHVFERLAEAEAKVHGTTVAEVHFHEVGAVDAIVDVVGAVLALELLAVERVVCSPIPTGSGTVCCQHGVLPVPAPATAELLRGVPITAGQGTGELTTPTAAAVLTTLASEFGPLVTMTVDSVGYGAGGREGQTLPNVLRVFVGEAALEGDADTITVLETNLDDASPEVVGHCMERLLREGALDVFAVPIHMKKSRGGVVLTVLCERDRATTMEGILFAETTTFGVRRQEVTRVKMRRRHESVSTPFGDVRMKIGERDDTITVAPEYEDCKTAAATHNVSLREVIAAAHEAWTRRLRT